MPRPGGLPPSDPTELLRNPNRRLKDDQMENVAARKALRTGLIFVSLLFSTNAFAFDLSGAWASERDFCGQVFTKKGSALGFAELSDLYGSGFIVNGNAIRGKSVQCTIKGSKQDGNATVLSASCATPIMVSDFQFRYKVIDDNTLIREFPDIKDMSLRYSRCSL